MNTRTRPCDEATTAGRLRKAEQFLEAAETIRESPGIALGEPVLWAARQSGVLSGSAIYVLP
jgi:hypothetical protein